MVFSKLENFLATNIEGFFNKKFVSQLEFEELIKIMERTLNTHKQKIDKYFFVPNKYVIRLNEDDYARIQQDKWSNRLRQWLFYYVIMHDYCMNDLPEIHLLAAPNLKLGICDIQPYFTKMADKAVEVEQGTIIISPTQMDDIEQDMASDKHIAKLSVIAGEDIHSHMFIGTSQVHLGRREQNEFIISDPNTSRIHAYISFEKGRHIIYDANSTNGTKVNNCSITTRMLSNDDIISIGNTYIMYNAVEPV